MANKYNTPAHEHYPTPDEAIKSLFEIVEIHGEWIYLEPCRGVNQRIYKYLPPGSLWAELEEGVDYLETKFPRVDCIITNPPFSLTQQFLEKSFQEADVVIYLQRLNYLSSKKRKDFWKNHKPDHLVVLSKRPSFVAGGKDKTDYAWYIWDRKGRLGLTDTFYFT